MTKALSIDLRRSVVAAVEGGLSRRRAAAHFGVSVSSAIRWTDQAKATGSVLASPVGGDRRSGRIAASLPLILQAVQRQPDITLMQLQAELADQGLRFGVSTIWRCLKRHKVRLRRR